MSSLPSKQAALSGVLKVFVAWFTLAPARTKRFTIPRWPAPAAHHKAVAPVDNNEYLIKNKKIEGQPLGTDDESEK